MDKLIETKDFATVTTSQLPTRVSETIVAAAVEQLKEAGVMRKHCWVDSSPSEGDKTYVYSKFDDLGLAYDRRELADFKYDSAAADEDTATILELAKGFKISWEADHLKKIAVKAAQTKACVQEVQYREDTKITTALASGTSTVAAAGALSGTSADPIADIREGIRKVRVLGYPANTLFIESVNLEELFSIIGSNDWYKIVEDAVGKGELPVFMGLKVQELVSAHLTHGTAYIAHTSGGHDSALWMGQGHDIRTHIFDDDDAHAIKVQVFERCVPVCARPDASATLTGW